MEKSLIFVLTFVRLELLVLSSCVTYLKWLGDSSCGGECSRVELVNRMINFDSILSECGRML